MSYVVLAADQVERFWSRIQKAAPTACWTWSGEVNNQGYGRFATYTGGQRRRYLAHRLAFTLAGGTFADGPVIRHACDNPPCCNPDHLVTGTMRQNSRDAIERGRADLSGLELGRVMPVYTPSLPKAARLRPDQHGLANSYNNWGCRCDPCRFAAAEHRRAKGKVRGELTVEERMRIRRQRLVDA